MKHILIIIYIYYINYYILEEFYVKLAYLLIYTLIEYLLFLHYVIFF